MSLLIKIFIVVIAIVILFSIAEKASANHIHYPQDEPRGVVIFVAGSGWAPVTTESAERGGDVFTRERNIWLNRDFIFYVSEHSGCKTGYDDIQASYDRIDNEIWQDQNYKIGVLGHSSGGHYAMMLARKRNPAFVATHGSPFNLVALPAGYARNLATNCFGTSDADLTRWSPVLNSPELIDTKLVQGHATNDTVVPAMQTYEMALKHRSLGNRWDGSFLADGDQLTYFMHRSVDSAEEQAYRAKERSMAYEATP